MSGAAPSLQLHAMGAAVVGLRTPVSEMVTPASTLKSWDLPLPVAPAMATTVCSPDSRRRATASSSTRPASASVRLSSRVRDSPTSSRRASNRDLNDPSYARGSGGWTALLLVSRRAATSCCPSAVSDTRRAISPSPQGSPDSVESAGSVDSVRPDASASAADGGGKPRFTRV
ncbi:hypothetical protein SAV14893_049010 [Streptomyces avermitilis]|uniref:Uncharacterized protein n=1 Tax=Streptomyces avermitilis TaxID=33903 RepID=A0A4D4M122_STRAX|nr:hypothetical protein SAV14893_049010 [Streptomyces avermitilis]